MATSAARARSGQRRTAILEAAAALFRERGFIGVGIDDIGAAVGISGPALYRYFAGKQELLADIVTGFLHRLVAATEEADGRQAVTRESIACVLRERDAVAISLRHSQHLDPDARREIDACLAQLTQHWAPILGARPDSAELALRMRAAGGVVISLSFTKGQLRTRLVELAVELIDNLAAARLPARPTPPSEPAARTDRPARASRREAILSAAAAQFRERGFNGVSLADIGTEVGITASAVNRHFRSKERLLTAAFTRAGEQIAAGITAALSRPGTPEQTLVDLVSTYATLAIDSRDLIVVNMSEMHHLPVAERRRRRRNQRMYVEELAHALGAVHPGLPEPEATLRSRAAFALVNEVISVDELVSRPNIRAELTTLALAVLRPVHS